MNGYDGSGNDDKSKNESENEVFASDIAQENENKAQQDPNPEQGRMETYYTQQGSETAAADTTGATGTQDSGSAQSSDYYTAGGYGSNYGYNGPASSGAQGSAGQGDTNPYGGNVQYKWHYDDYQKALDNKGKPPKKKNRGLRVFVICLCSVLGVAVVSLAGFGVAALVKSGVPSLGSIGGSTSASAINPNGPTLKTTNKPATASETSSSGSTTTALQLTAQQVYNKVRSSVVVVETYDDTSSLTPTGAGSGIVMSADGYIITNEHVIDGAVAVTVTLSDNKKYTAKVIGSDTKTDLAVLKVEATGLAAATFGNSDQINVAESVLAIGNPAGLGGSVTEGIISALNMSITSETGMTGKYIQTDAPINPGNSGGALVNMYGQVIGITSSKVEATGYEGMGFAIPINTAQPVINDLIKYGYVTGRVKLGISVVEIDATRAAVRGYPAGLQVQSVDSSSDAATKGIKKGDIITKINDVSATTFDAFQTEEYKYKAGQTVTLTVYRASTNSTFTASVKLLEDKGDSTATQSTSSSTNGYGYGYGNSSGTYGYYSPYGN